MKYKRIVVGIDQSYSSTGISICADGKLIKVSSIKFKASHVNSDKRKILRCKLTHILGKVSQMSSQCIVICERIRTFSGGFLSTKYMTSTGALVALIVDVAFEFNINVYSVDTRSWKSKIVGTTKPDSAGNRKGPTIKFVESLGFDVSYETRRGNTKYNDDAADSACIALYGFLPKDKRSLRKEV